MYGYVYILANKKYGTLYTGVTNHLMRRVHQHKCDLNNGFTKKYKIHKLVYFEKYDLMIEAIEREKQIKKWRRDKKIKLINSCNPEWEDLYEDSWQNDINYFLYW